MFKYTDESKWNNSASLHFILSFLMWVPVSSLFIYVAIEVAEMHLFLLALSGSLIWGLVLFKRAQTKIVFPTIEVSDTHIVLNTPVNSRSVYNVEFVEGAKFYWHILYFRHNGWPTFVPLPRMPKWKKEVLLDAIKN